MNQVLRKYFRKFILVYLDDIIIYSKPFKEHIEYVKLMFEVLQAAFLMMKPKKCKFTQKELQFLRHIISADRIRMDFEKIAKMITLPSSINIKELRLRLDLFFYY